MQIINFQKRKTPDRKSVLEESGTDRDFEDTQNARLLHILEDVEREQMSHEIRSAVISMDSAELISVIRKSARLKGRYLARILDLDKQTGLPSAAEITQIRSLRETFEELDTGIALFKTALDSGTIDVAVTTEAAE